MRGRDWLGGFLFHDDFRGGFWLGSVKLGQQPFGGARGSGTNDKAGSYLNLLRWVNESVVRGVPTDE